MPQITLTSPKTFFQTYWPYLLLIAVTLLAYTTAFGGAFILDDDLLIVKNSFTRSWSAIPDIFTHSSTAGTGAVDDFYRPLQGLLYLIIYKIFGLDPVAYHSLNILLHILNVCLMYKLGGKLGFSRNARLAASVLWAVHPLHVEAVTYISATADTLYAGTIMGGLLCWGDTMRRRLGTMFFYALALLSKEAGSIFPALLVVMMFLQANEKQRWNIGYYLRATWPLWAMAIGYFVLRGTVLDFKNTYQLYAVKDAYSTRIDIRTYTFVSLIPRYIALMVAPYGLHMERMDSAYDDPLHPAVLMGWCVIGLSIWAVMHSFVGKRKTPSRFAPLAWGIMWWFAAYFPCTGILVSVNALLLEHWMYLPSIGLFLGLAETVSRFNWRGDKGLLLIAAVMAYSGFLLISTMQQNLTWKDPITFYNYILRYEKGVARLHNNLGMAYQGTMRFDLAEKHYLQAIQTWDVYAQTHHNYGKLLLDLGREDEAIKQFVRALEIDANFFRSADALAIIYDQHGDKANAAKWKKYYEEHKPYAMPAEEKSYSAPGAKP